MTQEPNPNHPKGIKLEGTAQGESKLIQVGSVETENLNLTAELVQFLVHLESSTKPESPGVMKVGNPRKNLDYWQGRTEEIANLKLWLNNQNISLIGIEGIGGTGKSMLAAKIYEDETITGFRKRFWADVGYGAIFTDVATQVLQEFGYRVPNQETELLQALVKCLQSGEYLLIIDNLESLLQTNGIWGSLFYEDFFKTWVECGGKSTIIVTSRERPELPKRWQWLPLTGLKIEDGVALLTELGIQGNLTEFVKLVDGFPLLLRFVADLLKEEYPQDPHLKRLESLGLGNLRQLLTDAKVVGQHRLENVGMVLVLDASFERLSELQKSLLLNISVYRGVVNAKAAMAVCLGSSETEIERELRNLVKRSFLSEKLIDDGRWFEFQPVVLEYVRYKAGDQTEAHQKAINYYQSIAKQKPWQTKDDIQEYLEIFYHFYQLQDYESAFEEIGNCNDCLSYTDKWELYGQLVSKWKEIGNINNYNYLDSLIELSQAYLVFGKYAEGSELCLEGLEIARKIGDVFGETNFLINLGNFLHYLKNYELAINSLQECYEVANIPANTLNQKICLNKSICLNILGNVYNSLGEEHNSPNYHEEAIKLFQKSLQIKREIGGHRKGEGSCYLGLGNAYNLLKQYEQADNFYQQSLEISRETGARLDEGGCLNNLGEIHKSLGDYQTAIIFYEQSLDIKREIGDVRGEANAWFNLGLSLEKVDREQDALGAYRNARELFQTMGLDTDVQDCNNAIERLSQPKKPVVSQRGFWAWLRRFWRWLRGSFRR
ncbi:MAG: tetratricopeptide repeat protein [Nostocales cyanobacterium LE14-WE4]|nr:tetratricopeptide repeat protein [Anabaena sp. 49633_E8]MDJ0501530.1 tetratricopeptide repeat protein [Nostocales cyanobacterium LE14-WE4]